MSLFDGIETAFVGGRGIKLDYGRHLVRIQKVEGFKFRKGDGTGITTSYEVVVSGNEADPVGSVREYMQGINADTLGYVIKYAAACLGVDPTNKKALDEAVRPIVKKTMDAAISSEQVFRGVYLWVQVDKVQDKENKEVFYRNHSFFPAEAPKA